MHCVDLNVETKGIHKEMHFPITNIGIKDVILGYPWLATYKPKFSWHYGVIKEDMLPVIIRTINPCITQIPFQLEEELLQVNNVTTEEYKQQVVKELEEQVGMAMVEDEDLIIFTTTTELAVKAKQYKEKVEIPKEYKEFASVFSEAESQHFPPSHPWDHAIKFKPGAPDAIDCKIYPMAQHKDKAMQEFLKEQLAKGYNCPSKSPYTSPFFFIGKKDGKLQLVQDYRCINNITIHNQYPLPLIPELINDLSHAMVYTKLDIQWGYNNVQIKEGDEQEAAFKTHYSLFKPTVMFFGLTNSPAMFQTMMNHIYRDIIAKHELLGTAI